MKARKVRGVTIREKKLEGDLILRYPGIAMIEGQGLSIALERNGKRRRWWSRL